MQKRNMQEKKREAEKLKLNIIEKGDSNTKKSIEIELIW